MMNLTSPAMHLFDSQGGAGRATHAFHGGGFDVRKLSLVSQPVHREERPLASHATYASAILSKLDPAA